MTVLLESGTFRILVYDLNIENSLNSIQIMFSKHKMSVSVSVLVYWPSLLVYWCIGPLC